MNRSPNPKAALGPRSWLPIVAGVALTLPTTGCSIADFFAAVGRVTPTAAPAGFIGGGMGGRIGASLSNEDPLELTGTVHALSPDPQLLHPASTFFSSNSRTFLWIDDSGDRLMAAELGGQPRVLAPYNRAGYSPIRPTWTSDGKAVMVAQYAMRPHGGNVSGIPFQGFLISMADGQATVLGNIDPNYYVELIPDGSGMWNNRPVQSTSGPMPPDVLNNVERQVYVARPGQDWTLELGIGGPGFGTLAPDGKAYAYFEYPNHDPNQGMDLKLYDFQAKSIRTVYHMGSNPFVYGPPNFQWDGRRLAFSTRQPPRMQDIVVTIVNVDDGQSQVRPYTLPLTEQESAGTLQFSPDLTKLSYDVTETATYRSGNASGTYPAPRGIRVMSLADSNVQTLTPQGRVVCWLPGSQDLIASTGQDDSVRFYRVDATPN